MQDQAAFYVTGGTIPPDAPSYVERAADGELLAALERGDLCYVLNSRQMGKSSLSVRTRRSLEANGARTAFLDLQKFGSSATAEQWYRALLERIGSDLKLRAEFLLYWREHAELPPLTRVFGALTEVALATIPGRLVLFLDEIDVVRDLAFKTDEFFGAIRESYNARADDPVLARLTFCIIGTVAPTDLIRDIRLSPFNIGTRIRLFDLTPAEAAPLAAHLPGTTRTLDRVLWWTSGHPYLTQRLCAELARSASDDVDAMVARLFFSRSDAEVDENIKNVRNSVLRMGGEASGFDRTDLLLRYGAVVAGKRVADDDTDGICTALRLSGLTISRDGNLAVRNRIYARLFDSAWVRNNLPDAEVRRQRSVVKRARLQVTAIAAAVVMAMSALTGWALLNAKRADSSTAMALRRERDARDAAEAERRAKIDAVAGRLAAKDQARLAEAARRDADGATLRARTALKAEITAKAAALRNALKAHANGLAAIRSANWAKKLDYISTINLAQRDIEAGDFAHAEQLLEETRNDPERGFEWEYLNDLCHQELRRFAASSGAMSEDGRFCALAQADGAAIVDTDSGKTMDQIALPGVVQVDFLEGGKSLLIVHAEHQMYASNSANTAPRGFVSIYNVASRHRRVVANILLHARNLLDKKYVNLSPGGQSFAAETSTSTLGLFEARTGRLRLSIPTEKCVEAVALSKDGRWLAVSQGQEISSSSFSEGTPVTDLPSGHITLWDLSADKPLWTTRRWEAHSAGSAQDLLFTPGGHSLQVQGSHETAFLNLKDGSPLPGWPVQTEPGVSAVSHDGLRIAASGADGGLQVLSSNGRQIKGIRLAEAPASIRFSSRDGTMIVGGASGTIYLIDTESVQEIRRFRGHSQAVAQIALSRDGRRIFSVAENARLWYTVQRKEDNELSDFSAFVQAVSFSRDDRRIAASSLFYPLRIDDLSNGECIQQNTRWATPTDVRAEAQSADGNRIAILQMPQSKASHLQLQLLDVGSAKSRIRIFDKAFDDVLGDNNQGDLSFSADSQILSAISKQKLLRWNYRTGAEVATKFQDQSAESLSPDGKFVLLRVQRPSSRMLTSKCEIRDIDSGKLRNRLVLPAAGIGYKLSTSAKIIYSLEFNDVVIRDGSTGAVKSHMRGHRDAIACVACSPDSRRVATLSFDNTIRVWDTDTGRMLVTIKAEVPFFGGPALAFSHDGLNLAAAQQNQGIRIFRNLPESRIQHSESPRVMVNALKSYAEAGDPENVLARADDFLVRDPSLRATIADYLNTSAWMVVDPDNKKKSSADRVTAALRAAERACDLTWQKNGLLLDTLAAARFANGDVHGAVRAQREAVKYLPTNAKIAEAMTNNLKRYEALVSAEEERGK